MPETPPLVATSAIAGLLDDQVPPAVALVKRVDEPTQTVRAPLMAATTGAEPTVTVAVTVEVHPLVVTA